MSAGSEPASDIGTAARLCLPGLAIGLLIALSSPSWVMGAQVEVQAGAQSGVFRSVDDNGTPTFSQTPPAGRASRPVDLKPLSGSIDTARPALPAARPSPQPPVAPAAVDAPLPPPSFPARVPQSASAPRGMAFETFIRIRRGMSEGELLGRAGPPDYRGDEINRGLLQESWYYLPTLSDPFTTIIQIRGGRVVDTERIRKL